MKQEESRIQTACIKWFDYQYPKYRLLLFAIPNGAYLQGNKQQRAKRGARMKREGMREGVADLFLSSPYVDDSYSYNGFYIEMKTPTGRQAKTQKEFEKAVTEQGYKYKLCRSFDEFKDLITEYLKDFK